MPQKRIRKQEREKKTSSKVHVGVGLRKSHDGRIQRIVIVLSPVTTVFLRLPRHGTMQNFVQRG
ncbi:unnamed protein product [Nesidiocoris tenuis]|uniref:Uncharacterized protein n=1 Tax=Nesidiocoris tenuis TaxID=355587 RepID=A0A6H5GQ48_9HEMI|nr:unnamed protein product [Nesidiocoris tenuis]